MDKRIILLIGMPGAGKSTLAMNLMRYSSSFRVLSNDQIRSSLGLPVTGEKYTEIVYSEVLNRASSLLLKGLTPILDATYYKKNYRNKVYDFSREHNVKLTIIELDAGLQLCRERIIKRALDGESKVGGVNDKEKFDVLIKKSNSFSEIEMSASDSYLNLSTSNGYVVTKSSNFDEYELLKYISEL